jgi:hypothetical protein
MSLGMREMFCAVPPKLADWLVIRISVGNLRFGHDRRRFGSYHRGFSRCNVGERPYIMGRT